jgi:hypothetical protein
MIAKQVYSIPEIYRLEEKQWNKVVKCLVDIGVKGIRNESTKKLDTKYRGELAVYNSIKEAMIYAKLPVPERKVTPETIEIELVKRNNKK